MGNDQTNFEITDEETGEVFPINAESLVSNVRDVLMSRRRNQQEARVWGDLNEEQQQDEITAIQMLSKDLVGKVVEVVAARGLTCAHVEVNKFSVDVEKGEVVITSKGFASDDMLVDLAHSKGKTAKLTIVDERQFNEKSTLMVADKDQGNMFPDKDETDTEDDHISDADQYAKAVEIVLAEQKCSTSFIQRKLKIGYNRAGRLIEKMEADGIVSAPDHVGKRDILKTENGVDADLAADMDADLESMEEPDDLHKPEVEIETEDENSAEYMGGFNSRESGYAQGLNPFFGDAGTEQQFKDWDDGWRQANGLPGMIDVDLNLGVAVDETADEGVAKVEETSDVAGVDPEPEVEPDQVKDVEPETSDEPDLSGLSPREHGQQAMVKGDGPDDNPFDGGTDNHASWSVGYEDAAEEIAGLVETGRKAGAAKEPKKSCPWKKGTDGERFWLKGWTDGTAEADA